MKSIPALRPFVLCPLPFFHLPMNRTVCILGLMVALSGTLGAGCLGDAPHDNPFDPGSDRFVDQGTLEGQVTDRFDAPLVGAEVRLIPGAGVSHAELVTRTNGQGRYRFSDVPSGGGYRIQAAIDGYDVGMIDTLNVETGLAKQLSVLRLNALPTFVDITLRTVHISRWWPQNDQFFLEISAQVTDPDGVFDIESVWLDMPDLAFSTALAPQAAGQFEALIRADSLPTASLQSVLGRTLQLNVRDVEGVVVTSRPQQLVRVLDGTPTPTAPRDDVLLETDRPMLTWDPFPAGFSFTYRIDIYRAEVNRDVQVLQSEPIARGVTSLQLTTPLDTGPYFWTVTVVDDFGNQSRSKEAAFRIP